MITNGKPFRSILVDNNIFSAITALPNFGERAIVFRHILPNSLNKFMGEFQFFRVVPPAIFASLIKKSRKKPHTH